MGSRACLDGLAHDKISFAHRCPSQEYEVGMLSTLLPRSVTVTDPGTFVTPVSTSAAYLLFDWAVMAFTTVETSVRLLVEKSFNNMLIVLVHYYFMCRIPVLPY